MSLFNNKASLELLGASGRLRVTVTPPKNWLLMSIEATVVVLFARQMVRMWAHSSSLVRVFFTVACFSAVIGWLYQLSGSEEIEFSSDAITIRRGVLGWERTRQYPVGNCSEIEWIQDSEGRPYLRCKVGWRHVAFGHYLSEDQSSEVLKALQDTLPEVARSLGVSISPNKHFTTLGLS
jgi:hypothetical protein